MCNMEQMEKMHDEMGLTSDQKDQLKKLRKGMEKTHKAVKKKSEKLRNSMKKEYLKDTPDKAKLTELNKKLAGIKEQLGQDKIETMLKKKEILGKENFAKMMKMPSLFT